MEVKITFDTEKETIGDLKKLIAHLQQIVDQKENRQSYSPVNQNSQTMFKPEKIEQNQQFNRQKTSGGCEIIPFQDMNSTMEKIFSGKK
ncbi:MAG: hypothetical protein KKA65_00050 [Nanoarchaeota archaeon]|nr:hypothetical protein [Nanoarchaeota archaeon]MBU4242536.1 hypothetical protein [Nanoarchaeota archaeon]MBU4351555.1 hypothetical protein [Nanoarchaeota archaeon]MBU4455877.1 hypothetical protein [Nanoarchaeota archaeon]MCG2719743.1 hypothetical protein [Nanoarchaeota archaeon]